MKKKLIVFNATTNVTGGGIQNAAHFIMNAQKDNTLIWQFLISKEVSETCARMGADLRPIKIISSPARSATNRRQLKSTIKELSPDCVYTMAGPTYIKIPTLHIQGISEPYISHAGLADFFYKRSYLDSMRAIFRTILKGYWSREADHLVFQTTSSRDAYCKRWHFDRKKTHIVSNNLAERFLSGIKSTAPSNASSSFYTKKIQILCPGAPYPHKALTEVPAVAAELRRMGLRNFVFKLTCPKDSEQWKEITRLAQANDTTEHITSIGSYYHDEAYDINMSCDIAFIPSRLETFSTSYLEAMATDKPLVVRDKSFSRDICQDGALYFKKGPQEAAKIIHAIIKERKWSEAHRVAQKNIIEKYKGQHIRYNKIRQIITNVLNAGQP